jgi:hypothetical protein
VLAVVGLYGLLSYKVMERTPEIGVRMALGARTAEIVRLFLTQGLRMGITRHGGRPSAGGESPVDARRRFGPVRFCHLMRQESTARRLPS